MTISEILVYMQIDCILLGHIDYSFETEDLSIIVLVKIILIVLFFFLLDAF